MKFYFLAGLSLILMLTLEGPHAAAQSGAMNGSFSGYTDSINGQIDSCNNMTATYLQKFNESAKQLVAHMGAVATAGGPCAGPFAGKVNTAIDKANHVLNHDVDIVNKDLPTLVTTLQASTTDRSPASVSGPGCAAIFQTGMASMSVLLTNITSVQSDFQEVASDLAKARSNLQANDGRLRAVLTPREPSSDEMSFGPSCPPSALADYTEAKKDFDQMYLSFQAIQANLTNTSSFVSAKRGTLQSRVLSCSNIQ